MSGELHLDLCQQSTAHLKEVVAAIKENLRLLEVFLTSGLSEEERKLHASFISGEGSDIGSGFFKDSKSNSNVSMHKSCCCMCPTRQARDRGWMTFRSEGRHLSSPILNKGKQPSTQQQRPVSMPRLNRTASLRRESALERSQQRGDTSQSHSARGN